MKRYFRVLKKEWTWWSGWPDIWMLVALAGSFLLINTATEILGLPFFAITNITSNVEEDQQGILLALALTSAAVLGLSVLIPVGLARRGRPALGIFGLALLVLWGITMTLIALFPFLISDILIGVKPVNYITATQAEEALARNQIELETYHLACRKIVEDNMIYGNTNRECRNPSDPGSTLRSDISPEVVKMARTMRKLRTVKSLGRDFAVMWVSALGFLFVLSFALLRAEIRRGTFSLRNSRFAELE